MIEEQALVTGCDGEFAEVEPQAQSGCGSCAARSACGTGTLASVLGKKRNILRALNPIGAGPGERVVVGLEAEMLTRATLAAYGLPVATLIGGAMAGQAFGEWLALGVVEPFAVGGGLLGLLGGLAWLGGFSRRIAKDRRYQAVILRRSTPAVAPIHFHPR